MAIKNLFKYTISIFLLFSLASCGTILNSSAPPSLSSNKLSAAMDAGLIESTNTYIIYNVISVLLGGVGLIGLAVDYGTNSNYVVVDKPAFKAWSKEYDNSKKEELKKWSKK